ncbi:MAG: pyrroline-5-carboxylate reductase [Gammaproteobacteria bacterium RIFCSPHIGHO2_12_FULL_45_12]|nr:MAG: pyrroline-5-carboxylate reductase [Gammaproteobacteria bacterium RIFCSPHIGHO2_12_FULL_45_12]
MTTPVIAVIGTGNMGSSLIGGLIDDGHPRGKIWAADPSKDKLAYLQKTFQIHTTEDNDMAVKAADAVILAIKPEIMPTVTQHLQAAIQSHGPLIISIAAGTREKSLQHWLGGRVPIVRAMPNTPALIKCGATALFANQYVTPKQRNLAESILRAVGVVVWLDKESQLDTVTALSGSGPAYFFFMMEALQQSAEELGLPQDIARLLTLQTALGAARMAIESGLPLKALRQRVTSKGGTTEQGIAVLTQNDFTELFRKTLKAAKLRAEELAKDA